MKRLIKVMTVLLVSVSMIACFVQPASAVLIGKDGFYYSYDSNNNAVLEEYHSSNTIVKIPSAVYSHNIVAVADYAFLRNIEITSVTVPRTVTSIGNSSFYGCTSLNSIVIPNSVTSFGNSVFANCENLTIYCSENSAAAAYAQNNNISYEIIEDVILGDVDEDGVVSSNDSLLVLRKSVGLEEFTGAQETAADVDGDGSINSFDSLAILRYSVGIIDTNFNIGESI